MGSAMVKASVLIALLIAGPITVPATVLIQTGSGQDKISVKAENATLGELLGSLDRELGIHYICPKELLKNPIAVDSRKLRASVAVAKIFRDYNYALVTDELNNVTQIVIVKYQPVNDTPNTSVATRPSSQPYRAPHRESARAGNLSHDSQRVGHLRRHDYLPNQLPAARVRSRQVTSGQIGSGRERRDYSAMNGDHRVQRPVRNIGATGYHSDQRRSLIQRQRKGPAENSAGLKYRQRDQFRLQAMQQGRELRPW